MSTYLLLVEMEGLLAVVARYILSALRTCTQTILDLHVHKLSSKGVHKRRPGVRVTSKDLIKPVLLAAVKTSSM